MLAWPIQTEIISDLASNQSSGDPEIIGDYLLVIYSRSHGQLVNQR